ncbi:MAG: carbohydrate kinase, partial [Bacteroidales bacterium]|nr:carbohydrate kinase [Bacteroidales bacterium]
MYFVGYDLGSSSIKASVFDGSKGVCVASASYPETEMPISVLEADWAEQDPGEWWDNIIEVTKRLLADPDIDPKLISAIGIAYQMHGLVLVDKDHEVLRPSIIWCDSRAVNIGDRAFAGIGEEKSLKHLLNSPGNFTASKLAWVMENEPETYKKIYKMMLPGDYIAMKFTGEITTTVSGLSEGIFWDYNENGLSEDIFDYFGFDKNIFPSIVPTFGEQGVLKRDIAVLLGLRPGIPVTYRAGDQPNNAFSLNVLNPGELAATAGTSGVVYGISDEPKYDKLSRVNTFAHVNHNNEINRLGVLMCVNGTGILNAWLKRNMASDGLNYDDMNQMAGNVPVGSEGLVILPFGNGAERILENRNVGSSFYDLNFNIHSQKHVYRAAQEGIAFAFRYGIDIMKMLGIKPDIIRAGNANMFLSPVFRETLAGVTGANIELFNTDGSEGAARGAGLGAGFYKTADEA